MGRSTRRTGRASHSLSVLTILALVIAGALVAPAQAGQFTDAELGYSLTVPDDWRAIPTAAVDALYRRAINLQNPPAWKYNAGFQPADHKRNFQFPYILVQSQPYPGGRHVESISENDLKEIVAGITGLKMSEVRKTISIEASHAIQSINSPTASYFTEPPGFRMTFSMSVAGVQIHGQSMALIGKDRCVMIHFYAPQSQWEEYQPTFQQIAASFHLSPDQQASLGGFNWSRVGTSSFVGGMIGGGAGVVIWMLKRLGKGTA